MPTEFIKFFRVEANFPTLFRLCDNQTRPPSIFTKLAVLLLRKGTIHHPNTKPFPTENVACFSGIMGTRAVWIIMVDVGDLDMEAQVSYKTCGHWRANSFSIFL